MDTDGNQTVAQKMQFAELCQIFSKIKATTNKQSKRQIFDDFLRRWRQEKVKKNADGFLEYRTDDTFYPALRLFTPTKDMSRKFQMGETKLTNLMNRAANADLPKQIPPKVEDFVEQVATKVHGFFRINQPKMSIADVNEYLDRIANNKIEAQENALRFLVKNFTLNELRWISYILLGSCESALGVSAHFLLEWFRKGANNLWRDGTSLLEICERFAEEDTAGLGGPEGTEGNLLCKPFRPMLLKRLNYDKYCLPKIIKMCGRPFYMEPKYDGEHLLVHRYDTTNYKYFTRKGNDYTHKMGNTCERLLSKRIHPFFRPQVKSCVLDCELLIWDKKKQEFVGKGRKASDGNVHDPKHMEDEFIENHAAQFDRCLAVFDILYLNSKCLLQKGMPLKDRMQVLDSVFQKQEESTIFVSRKQQINKAQDFTEFYRSAMRRGDEGVVVKSLNSLYQTGSRAERNGWFKIKPDYGIQTVLDLAIVGVRFENGSLAHIKSFLVAARVEDPADGEFKEYKIVGGITSRLRSADYQRLDLELGDRESWLECRPGWVQASSAESNNNNGKHDRYLPRDKIKAVEVRASGLIDGKLQFPSIVAVRYDKPADEVDTVDGVAHFDERLRARPMVDEADVHEKTLLINRRRRNELHLKESNKLVPANGPEKGSLSRALEGHKVCVLNADNGTSTQELQKILITLGATTIANPTNNVAFLVAMNPNKMSCAAQIKADRFHIVSGSWLLRCREQGALLKWEDDDMIHTAPGTPFDLFELPDEEEEQEVPTTSAAAAEENGVIEEEENSMELDTNIQQQKSAAEAKANGKVAVGGQEKQQQQQNGGGSPSASGGSESDLSLTEMNEEVEAIRQTVANQLVEQMGAEDCQPVDRGNIYAGFVFFLHESVHGDGRRNAICRKVESEGGQIASRLDTAVTHVVIGEMRFGAEQPLFDWMESRDYEGNFVSAEWLEKAKLEPEDRYRMSEHLHEFVQH